MEQTSVFRLSQSIPVVKYDAWWRGRKRECIHLLGCSVDGFVQMRALTQDSSLLVCLNVRSLMLTNVTQYKKVQTRGYALEWCESSVYWTKNWKSNWIFSRVDCLCILVSDCSTTDRFGTIAGQLLAYVIFLFIAHCRTRDMCHSAMLPSGMTITSVISVFHCPLTSFQPSNTNTHTHIRTYTHPLSIVATSIYTWILLRFSSGHIWITL